MIRAARNVLKRARTRANYILHSDVTVQMGLVFISSMLPSARGNDGLLFNAVVPRNIEPVRLELALGSLPSPEISLDNDWIQEHGLFFAVPKRKVSPSRRRIKNRNKRFLKDIEHTQMCPTCGEPKLRHVLCESCLSAGRIGPEAASDRSAGDS